MKVAIIGGGAAGLMQAIQLQNRNIEVTVYEKLLERPNFTRVVGLDFRSLRTLKRLRILKPVLEIGYKVSGSFIYENDHLIAALNLDEINDEFPYFLSISLSVFETFLETQVKNLVKGVTVKLIESKDGKKRITLEDGSSAEYDLVVGADGVKSIVRKFAGIKIKKSKYPFKLEIANQRVRVKEERAQIYFEKGKTCMLRFPYSDNHVQVIRVLSDKRKPISDAKTNIGENENLFVLELDKFLANTFYRDGILLLGDAGHHMTPFGGRALNLSIEDTNHYAKAIVEGKIEKAAKARRKRAKTVILETHILAKTVSKGSKMVLWLFKFFGSHPHFFNKMLKMHLNITKGKS